MKSLFALITALLLCSGVYAQPGDSIKPQQSVVRKGIDSIYLQRLNTRGNLFIAGGIGLNLAGGYLIYQGVKVYNTEPPTCPPGSTCDQAQQKRDNQRQGTIYMAVGGTAIAGGVVLTALGAKAKVDFKRAKKYMSLQSGIKPDGSVFVAFRF
jgi:hypothetical protein